MGVAVRAYFTSPLSQGDHLESWLELWDGKPHESDLLPGYGWAFPVGDGTVNVGLGMLNSSDAFQKTDYRSLMTRWLSHLPAQWGLTPTIRGADPWGCPADGLQPHPCLRSWSVARR